MQLMNQESDGPRGGRQFYWFNEKYDSYDRGNHELWYYESVRTEDARNMWWPILTLLMNWR
jgi:hypothetical protein